MPLKKFRNLFSNKPFKKGLLDEAVAIDASHFESRDRINVDNVTVLSKAAVKEHPTPVKPRPLLNIAIALACMM